MGQPKISLNKLGEYMIASAARRRRIIEDQINPKDFITARYTDARENIADYISGNIEEQQLVDAANKLRNQSYESKFIAQNKNLSADAIDDFLEVSDQLTFDYKLEKVPSNNSSKLEISGVLVSIKPDIYLKDDNDKVVGYIKLHFPKTNPLTTISGEFVATALKTFLQNDSPSPIDPKLCVVVDIPSATVFSAPKAGKKRMTDLEAACEEISDRWQVKTS